MTSNPTPVSYVSEDAIRTVRMELENLWEKFIRQSATERDINKHILISIVRIVSSIFNMRKIEIESNNILRRLCRKGGEPIFFTFKQLIPPNPTREILEEIGKLVLPQLLSFIGHDFNERIEMIKMRFLRIFPNFRADNMKEQVVPDMPEMFEKATEDMFSTHLPFELEQIINRKKTIKNFQSMKRYLMMMIYDYKKTLLYLITSMNWMVTALGIKKTQMFNVF